MRFYCLQRQKGTARIGVQTFLPNGSSTFYIMMDTIYDPFTIDLGRQWESIAPLLDETAHARIASSQNLAIGLSNILHDSRYTTLVATKFRPILFVLCAVWIDQDSDLDAKLAALAFLLHSHEELFPYVFLRASGL